MKLLRYIYRLFVPKITLVKVYSHPRSGTHFLEAFLSKNFYQNEDLSLSSISWGHWANRQIKTEGNPFGKLFGSHSLPKTTYKNEKKIYIIRDPRAVAYSIWKTKNFVHPNNANLSFSQFLRTPIDWIGTPAKKTDPTQTILEHWKSHTDSWRQFALKDANTLILSYEELKDNPFVVYEKIQRKYFSKLKKIEQNKIDPISEPLGLLPNKGTKDAWKNFFSTEDIIYLEQVLKH